MCIYSYTYICIYIKYIGYCDNSDRKITLALSLYAIIVSHIYYMHIHIYIWVDLYIYIPVCIYIIYIYKLYETVIA